MKFKKLFLIGILGILFSLNITSVRAENLCLHVYKNYNSDMIYDGVNYDYFCGNNSNKNKCYSSNSIYGSLDYQLSTKKISGATEIKDKYKCYAADGFMFDNTCYSVKNIKGGNAFYAYREEDIKNEGIYILSVTDANNCIKKSTTSGTKGDVSKNYDISNVVSCGDGLLTDIPKLLPRTIHIIYLIIQILVPILLVIFGSLDFIKGVIASKDDEINKSRGIFIKRLIYGIIIFFVFSIVKLIISFAGDSNNKKGIINCASCIINNDSNCVAGG